MPAVNFLPFLASIPPATRLLTILLFAFSTAFFVLRALSSSSPSVSSSGKLLYQGRGSVASLEDFPYVMLVPGSSLWFPWVWLTSAFVETNVLELVVSLITLPLCARYLERVWGAMELYKFCAIVIVSSNVIAAGLNYIEWIVLGKADLYLYGMSYHGLSALQTGFLVAFTQLIPEHQVQLFGVFKVRVKRLPGIYLLISNVLTVVLSQSPYILIQFGFFTAWVYLRFIKMSENGEFRGDRSETFAFTSWFPPILHKPIGALGNVVFNLCVKLNLVRPWGEGDASMGGYGVLPGPGGARAEAERRRAIALKALDARMASSTSSSSTAAPATSTPTASAAAPAATASSNTATATAEVQKEESVKEGEVMA